MGAIFCLLTDDIPEEKTKKIISSRKVDDEVTQVARMDQSPMRAGDPCYIVDASWLDKWYRYASATAPPLPPYPGSIDNSRLIDGKTGKLRADMRIRVDFRPVHKDVWEYLLKIYGGTLILYFTVPVGFSESDYATGSWSKLVDFYSLNLVKSQPPPELMVSNYRRFGDVVIVGVDVVLSSTNNLNRKLHAVYHINTIPPSDAPLSYCAKTASRTYDEFILLDQTMRKLSKDACNLTMPTFPVWTNDASNLVWLWFFGSSLDEYLECRRCRLEAYLRLVISQPGAWQCPSLQLFLNPDIVTFDKKVLDNYNISYVRSAPSSEVGAIPSIVSEKNIPWTEDRSSMDSTEISESDIRAGHSYVPKIRGPHRNQIPYTGSIIPGNPPGSSAKNQE